MAETVMLCPFLWGEYNRWFSVDELFEMIDTGGIFPEYVFPVRFRYDGFGKVDVFEIVDKIPTGFFVWNICDNMGHDEYIRASL